VLRSRAGSQSLRSLRLNAIRINFFAPSGFLHLLFPPTRNRGPFIGGAPAPGSPHPRKAAALLDTLPQHFITHRGAQGPPPPRRGLNDAVGWPQRSSEIGEPNPPLSKSTNAVDNKGRQNYYQIINQPYEIPTPRFVKLKMSTLFAGNRQKTTEGRCG